MSITLEEAVKAGRRGGYAAFVSAGFTFLVLLIALFSNSADGLIEIYDDPWVFFDVILLILCGFGMLRMSRAAAIVVCGYWVFGRIYLWLETGLMTGLPIALVFLYFFAHAAYGSFVFHNLKKRENPDYKSAPRWTYWVGIPSGVLFALIGGLGLLSMTSIIPSSSVINGTEIPSSERSTLLNLGIVEANEQILYFYSDDLTSVANAGNVLTDIRVVRYFVDDFGELAIYELYLNQIDTVRLEVQGNFLNDSVYRVIGNDPEAWFQLALSTEDRGDVRFVEAIRSRIQN